MDEQEIAARLQQVRDRVQRHLVAHPPPKFSGSAPGDHALTLEPRQQKYQLPVDPSLHTTDHLVAANSLASITAPINFRSKARFVGPLVDLVRKLARPIVQAILDPYLTRQENFNAEIARHLNALGGMLERRIELLGGAIDFWSQDPTFLEIRLEAAMANYDAALRHRHTVLFDALEDELWALQNLARDGLTKGDDIQRLEATLVERAQAVDKRFDEKDAALTLGLSEHGEAMRAARARSIEHIEATQAELLGLRTRLRVAAARTAPTPAPAAASGGDAAAPGLASGSDPGDWLQDDEYVAFQNAFRGDPEAIRQRLQVHLGQFDKDLGPVVDLGCGRGELLDLLIGAGHTAKGVELNIADVDDCRRRGLDVENADLFAWLEAQPEESLGGIVVTHVIEHLAPGSWSRLVDLSATRLAPGGKLIIETINPESLYALVRAYVIDPTHVRPVHPELVAFLARRAGLHPVEVNLQAPTPDADRPLPLELGGEVMGEGVAELAAAVNERLGRIDRLCCAPQEYALYATRPTAASGGGADE